MDIGLIGMGAVGMFVSHRLKSRGLSLTGYVRRQEQLDDLINLGIVLDDQAKKVPVRMVTDLMEHDLYIVATKKYDTDRINELLSKMPQSRVLYIQNGMVDQTIQEQLPHAILAGVMDHGVVRKDNFTIEHKGEGQLVVGALSKSNEQEGMKISTLLNDDKFKVIYDEDIEKKLKEKLVVNCVVNPITAILEMKNGKVFKNPSSLELAKQLNKEACHVLNLDEEQMWQKIQSICERTKENKSSMFADILNGRKTEIDYLNGYLVKRYGEHVPTHQTIYHLLRAKESQRGVGI